MDQPQLPTPSSPLCSECKKKPCAPKQKGQGLCVLCRDCRNKANARMKKTRTVKKKQDLLEIFRQELRAEMKEDADKRFAAMENRIYSKIVLATRSGKPSFFG